LAWLRFGYDGDVGDIDCQLGCDCPCKQSRTFAVWLTCFVVLVGSSAVLTGEDGMDLPEILKGDYDREIEAAKVFSFDVPRFHKEVGTGDMLALVIRGHIYLEHVLIQTVSEEMARPDEVEMRRLSFPAKLDLGIAMGLIDPDWRPALNRVNEMRNKMAHRLEYTFDDKEKMELWRMVPKYAQDVCFDEGKPWTEDDAQALPWVKIISAIAIMLETSRQSIKQQRIGRKYAMLNARHVLNIPKEVWMNPNLSKSGGV
jgi:hypothetical protein